MDLRCRFALFALPLLSALIVAGEANKSDSEKPATALRHFVEVGFDRFPRSVIMRDFCDVQNTAQNTTECWEAVRETGRVWAADINDDHVDELLLYPGRDWTGSGGLNFFLYQRRGAAWHSIALAHDSEQEQPGWFTDRPRFDILPISRNGYHDLRVAVDECLKWSGEKYAPYERADYHGLMPAWFDNTEPREAEIFWMIHYADSRHPYIQPQWFPISPGFVYNEKKRNASDAPDPRSYPWRNNGERSRMINAETSDPTQNIHWVSLNRAGVWGIWGDRGFLLVPRTSYLGACRLEIKAEWLLGFEDCSAKDQEPDFQYNRRTHTLKVSPVDDPK